MSGIYDIHCHIIFDVDDGPDDIDGSLEIIRSEYEQGVRGIIFTPHYRMGMFEPRKEKVLSNFAVLKEKVKEIYPDIECYLGCEVHYYTDVLEKVERHPEMYMTSSRYLLTEFSESNDPGYVLKAVNAVRMGGAVPIVAHVERYSLLEIDDIIRLCDIGARIQINAGSVIGKESRREAKISKKLLEIGAVSFIGSDAHNTKGRPVYMGKCHEFVKKKFGEEYAREIFVNNPEKIILEGRNKNAE